MTEGGTSNCYYNADLNVARWGFIGREADGVTFLLDGDRSIPVASSGTVHRQS